MENEERNIVKYCSQLFDISNSESESFTGLKKMLAQKINQLINEDFTKLVNILYRIDVYEKKLKTALEENKNKDAGEIIATLVLERLKQKEELKKQFKPIDDQIADDEKW